MSAQQHQSNSQRGQQPYPTQPPYPQQPPPLPSPQLPYPQQPGQPQPQPYSAQAYPPQPQQPPWQYPPQSGGSPAPTYPPPNPPPYPPQPYYFERKRGTGQAKRVFLAAVTPWTAARFLLKPKTGERIRDRKLTLLASSRAVLAALVVMLATVNFRKPWETLSGSWDTFTHIWLPAALLAPMLFVVLLAVTRSNHRAELLSGALRLLWRLLLGAACIALPLLVLCQTGAGMEPTEDDHALSFSIQVLLVYAWLPLFGACAVYWGARSGLWLGELHPLLGPIGSTSLMLLITGQVMVQLGLSWWFVLIGCGVVGTLVLAVFEFRRARLIGCRFRGGPEPVPVVLPKPAVADSGVALSEDSVLPRGLRDPDRRRPLWIRAEAFPKTVAVVDGLPGGWGRLRGIAATIGNAVSVYFRPVAALFAAVGRGIAKPFAPIVRFVRRKRSARRDFGTARPTAVGEPNRVVPGLAVVVFPWSTARYLFKPEVGPQSRDRLLDRLGFWRAVAGLAVVVLTTIQYQWSALLWDLTGKGFSTIELGVFVGAPAAILMAIDARQYWYGPKLRQGLVSVVKRAGLGLLVAIPLPLGIVVGIVVAFILAFTTPVGPFVLPMIPMGVVALLWCVPFLVCTFYWAVRSCLWISEVNPLLAPVATTVFAAAISIEEIATATTATDTTNATNGVPVQLWLSLNIFGLITTVLLGTAEFQHARSLGYQFLRGRETVPVPADPQQPSSGIVRPVVRDLWRLARDHYHHVRKTDR